MAIANFSTAGRATARVFVTALKSLPQSTQEEIVLEILRDKNLREDIMDLAVAEERSRQPSRPLKEFLSEFDAKGSR